MPAETCRLYLISPPALEIEKFSQQLKSAFDGGDVGAFQLRMKAPVIPAKAGILSAEDIEDSRLRGNDKQVSDDEILRAAEALIPICREYDVAFILNDSPELAKKCGADGVHLGQDDFLSSPSQGEGGEMVESSVENPHPSFLPKREKEKKKTLAEIRKLIGNDVVIGVSCHDSRHLAMEAGEDGADYVAFGAFYPTTSKSAEALAKYGTPDPDILNWWQTYMVLPCVAIGGINPLNCLPLVRAGADFIAVITAVWNHPESPKKAVEEFNKAIKDAGNL